MTKREEAKPADDAELSGQSVVLHLPDAALEKMQELAAAQMRPTARLRAAAERHKEEAQARGRSSAQRKPSGGRNQ